MVDYEKLGVFYLGKPYDAATRTLGDAPYLYDAKDLTTHAVCVGMTGSGKTGLCLATLEEAALDGIGVIAIDVKGDIANLALTFPALAASDFAPWVDAGAAERKGLSVAQYAEDTAATWRKGLADWQQDGARIARLRKAAQVTVFTPGARIAEPLALLRDFAAPAAGLRENVEAVRERASGAVASLLALMEIDSDPMIGREHVLLTTIVSNAWTAGRSLTLADLITLVQQPGFSQVGVMHVDTFFPPKERFALAMRMNTLLASPAFAQWSEGAPLDIGKLLWTEAGQPRISVLSIAHLDDAQRMFFVATLLTEVVAWMRQQAGASSLRAILYMDEIYGYFPPTAAPPSKKPMLTLLKQARAFGLGIMVATQNPVDLDYKGLANCGTWMIGRLQTERDKARLLDGLVGAAQVSGQTLDRGQLDTMLSALENRVFLIHNVHDGAPVLIKSRFAMSYLPGPLDRAQLGRVAQLLRGDGTAAAAPVTVAVAGVGGAVAPATSMASAPAALADVANADRAPSVGQAAAPASPTIGQTVGQGTAVLGAAVNAALSWLNQGAAVANSVGGAPVPGVTTGASAAPVGTLTAAFPLAASQRPALPPEITQVVVQGADATCVYLPCVLARGQLHFVDAKRGVDVWRTIAFALPVDAAAPAPAWGQAVALAPSALQAQAAPTAGVAFVPPSAVAAAPKSYTALASSAKNHLYANEKLTLYVCAAPKASSRVDEALAAFRVRLTDDARGVRDEKIAALRKKYAAKVDAMEAKLAKANAKIDKEKAQASASSLDSALAVGTGILGAVLGRKTASMANLARARSAARSASKTMRERGDVTRATAEAEALEADLAALEAELQTEVDALTKEFDPANIEVTEVALAPKKADIALEPLVLAWVPWTTHGVAVARD